VVLAEKELSDRLTEELPEDAEIVDRKVNVEESENGVLVTVNFICHEDIGTQRIIDKTELLEYDILEVE